MKQFELQKPISQLFNALKSQFLSVNFFVIGCSEGQSDEGLIDRGDGGIIRILQYTYFAFSIIAALRFSSSAASSFLQSEHKYKQMKTNKIHRSIRSRLTPGQPHNLYTFQNQVYNGNTSIEQ